MARRQDAIGHVELAGRPYKLVNNGADYRRYSANQMAPKLSTAGSSEYGGSTQWDYEVDADWQGGIGQPPDGNGLHYGEIDSRLPGRLTLPGRLYLSDSRAVATTPADCRYMPPTVAAVWEVGLPARQQVCFYLEPLVGTLRQVWVYARLDRDVNLTWELYAADAAHQPTGAVLDSGVITSVAEDKQFRWYGADGAGTVPAAARVVVLTPTAGSTCELAVGAAVAGFFAHSWDGAAWQAETQHPLYFTDVHAISAGSAGPVCVFNDVAYLAQGAQLYKYVAASDTWTAVGAARPAAITALTPYGTTLYIGQGDAAVYHTMSTLEAYTAGTSNGRLFYNNGWYLWKAVANAVYYSSDGTAWSDPIYCAPTGMAVTSIAEYNEFVHVTTEDGLLVILDGDKAEGVSPWASRDAANGVGSTVHNGILYTPVLGQLLQHQAAGVRNIWGNARKEDLPTLASGKVSLCTKMTNWLVIVVESDSPDGHDTLWCWQDEGWHHLATLPTDVHIRGLAYDRTRQRLWLNAGVRMVFSLHVPDYLLDPTLDPAQEFMPFGWLETAWFAGGLYEEVKDFEGIYVRGRDLASNQSVDVYWQDDTSQGFGEIEFDDEPWVDDDGVEVGDVYNDWFYLGNVTRNQEELIFGIANDLRPASREFRLGLLLRTTNGVTPRLYAYRIAYQMMLADWYAWTVPIEVSGTVEQPQELLGGTVNPYTRDQQKAHLDVLLATPGPFTFRTLGDETVQVKIRDHSWQVRNVDYYNGAKHMDGVYLLTLEEARHGSTA